MVTFYSIKTEEGRTLRDFKMIRYDTIPCWYELSWREPQGIILRIHSDFVNKKGSISTNAPIVGHYAKEFKFTKFSGEFGKNFGFEDSLQFLGESDGFIEYLVPTPLVRKLGGKCKNCGGSGKDEENWNCVCLHCGGEGKNIRFDYTEAYAVSATLTTLFEFMTFPQFETSCHLPQLITVKTVTIRDSHGGSVGGEYSKEAVNWMKRHGPGEIPEMISVMRSVWTKMDGEMRDYYDHSFHAWLGDSDGWLCTDCPGDACGLHPDHNASYDMREGLGFGFGSHNTDTPQQQLTLLASLATLHDLMRKD